MHTYTHTCIQKAFRNFHLFKRAGGKFNKVVAWPAVGDGWSSMGGWTVWETDVSSLGLGQGFLFLNQPMESNECPYHPSPSPPHQRLFSLSVEAKSRKGHPPSWGNYDLGSHFAQVPRSLKNDSFHGLNQQGNAFLLFCFVRSTIRQIAIHLLLFTFISLFLKFVFPAWAPFWSW